MSIRPGDAEVLEGMEKTALIRRLHRQVSHHFDSESKIGYDHGMRSISVNGLPYSEEEFDRLLEVLKDFLGIEADRLSRLRDEQSK